MADNSKPNKSPAMWEHCVRVYEAMEAEATVETIYEKEQTVWTGFLTKLFRDLELSIPAYTYVRQELMRMGCIRQMRRGGGTSPSVWVLFGAPTLEKYNQKEAPSVNTKAGATKRRAVDILQKQINDLYQRVSVLEEALAQKEAS